jgi:cytochrome c-type protein NapB
MNVALVSVVGVALVGFLTATRILPTRGGYRSVSARAEDPEGLVRAPKQRDMERTRYAERAAQQQAALATLASPPRGLLDAVQLDPQAYAAAVVARAERRAYDGAPPTIPHAVDQVGALACLACHDHGMRVFDKTAPPMGHQAYASCLQCHAVAGSPFAARALLPHSVSEQSAFVSRASAGKGPRALPGAPPQIPHRTFMRERCASCHGLWAQGIASSHPYRQSCTQCHAPSSFDDQMPRSTFAKLGALTAGRP